MDQASQLWVNELTRVSANLTVSIQQLQEAFQIRSDQSISEGCVYNKHYHRCYH